MNPLFINKNAQNLEHLYYSREVYFNGINFSQIEQGSSTCGRVTRNLRTSCIARLKVHGRLPIRNNWTFFTSSNGWDFISRYWLKGGGSLWPQTLGGRGHCPNHYWCQKTRVLGLLPSEDRMILSPFVWVQYQNAMNRQTAITLCVV